MSNIVLLDLHLVHARESLERLDYDAESRRKVVSSRLGFAMRRLENSLCQPSSINGYLFRIREG